MNSKPDLPADGGIFICYRREDTAGYAGRLADRLVERFGDRVFIDVDAIEPGAVFAEVIADTVTHCRVLLVLIGDEWVNVTGADGRRRLDIADDFIRVEIETALNHDVWVIPVLVEDTPMPALSELPPSLARLAGRHALPLSSTRFHFDCGRLLDTIGRVLDGDGHDGTPPPPPVPPGIRLSHTEVDFGTLNVGTPSPVRTIHVDRTNGGPLNARVRADHPWIEVRQVDGTVELRIDTAVVGRLDGELRISGDGDQASVRVRALVLQSPTLAVDPPGPVDFGRVHLRAHPEFALKVRNAGHGELEWTHRSRGSFFQADRTPGGLRLRLLAATPGPQHGSISIESNGGDATLDVRAELLPLSSGRQWWRGPWLALGLVALLVLAGFTLFTLSRHESPPPPSTSSPEHLEDVVADFGTFTRTGQEGAFDLDNLEGFFGDDADRVRKLLTELGFQRGYARGLKSTKDEGLSVLVIEFGSAAAARTAEPDLGVCRNRADSVGLTSIEAATLRRCKDSNGRSVQEVVFTRGPRSYRLKLDGLLDPASTELITGLARLEAQAAR